MLWPKRETVLSHDLGARVMFVRPAQPGAAEAFSSEGLWISRTHYWNLPFCWDFKKLANPHVVVVGVSGSGKSYFLKQFLTKANLQWGTRALILDWSGEYQDWVRQAGGTVLKLGQESLNPLDLAGMTPFERIQQLVPSLSLLAGVEKPAQKQWLCLALEETYRAKGFSLNKTSGKNPPTLADVFAWLSKKTKNRPGVEELCLHLRLLCAQEFLNKKSTISLDALFGKRLADVDLTGLPSEGIRSLIALSLLQFAREKMRRQCVTETKRLEQFIVLDEAWKICGVQGDPSVMVREGRKHGLGLIVASQNPQDIHSAILSNAASLFAFRTPHAASLDALQGSLGFSNDVRHRLAGLSVGVPAVHLLWQRGFSHTFFLTRIDGESLLQSCVFEVNGMTWIMEKTKLLSGFNDPKLSEKIDAWLSARGYSCDTAAFCQFLEEQGASQDQQLLFLKTLGLDADKTRAVLSAKAQNSSSPGMRWADVVV